MLVWLLVFLFLRVTHPLKKKKKKRTHIKHECAAFHVIKHYFFFWYNVFLRIELAGVQAQSISVISSGSFLQTPFLRRLCPVSNRSYGKMQSAPRRLRVVGEGRWRRSPSNRPAGSTFSCSFQRALAAPPRSGLLSSPKTVIYLNSLLKMCVSRKQ